MFKKALTILIILALSLSIIGCSNKTNETSDSQELQPLTIGVMPDVDSIPFIIAQHNGYFEEVGLDLTIEHFKSAMDRDTALQTGNIDGAISDMLAVVFLNDNDFDVKITSMTTGSFKTVASKASGITSITELEGKSTGISTNTIIDYLTDRILDSSKVNLDAPERVAIPKIPTRLEMLNSGKIDSATLPEPLASVALHAGGVLLSSSDALNINPGIMLFTSDVIRDKTEEIKALYSAYNKAVDYLKTESLDTYINVLIDEAGFPPVIKETLTLPQYSKATLPKEEEFTAVLKWLTSKGLTESTYQLKDVLDEQFISEQ